MYFNTKLLYWILLHQGFNMTKVLILYYSRYGHTERLAKAEAEGARAAGADVDIKRVPELLRHGGSRKTLCDDPDRPGEITSVSDMINYDAIIFGTPTRFGNMCAQMRDYLNQTGDLWSHGEFIGKVGSVFTSSALQHWGQETTIVSFHTSLLHLGFIIVGVPPDTKGLFQLDEISGGSPYGASTIAGVQHCRQPTENEISIAFAQGENVARVAARQAGH